MDSTDVVPGSLEDRDINRFPAEPFPTFDQALPGLAEALRGVEGTPYRLEVGLLASRELTFKVWTKESEEAQGGVLSL
jgi:hypothetical protein